MTAYPHQLSGGMNQRVMIAMAIACNPALLIADEPTTALDVTIQAQIMTLLKNLQRDRGMAMVLISHDLAVVSEMADRVAVMYAGEMIERQAVPEIFTHPRHPYTRALLDAIPEHHRGTARLAALPGTVPGRDDRPSGCVFAPRCPYVETACTSARPALMPVDEKTIAPHRPDGRERAAAVRCIKPLTTPVDPTPTRGPTAYDGGPHGDPV
jgi:dipeptide transport system ATP-binding protein